MKPLSAFAFIKGSMSKIVPMVITVCLAVAMLYFLSLFLIKMDNQVKEANTDTMEHMSFIVAGKFGIPAEELRDLKRQSGDINIYPADIWDVVYKTVIGGTGSSVYVLQQKDIKPFMGNEKFSLIKGRLPEKSSEIILHKKLATNYGLKVGSAIKKKSREWNIPEDLKVVGLFDGNGVMGIGMRNEGELELGLPYVSAVVAGNDIERANKYIEKYLYLKHQIYTISTVEDFLNKFNSPIDAMKIFIGTVLIAVLGVFMANITSIQYSVRKKELELLYAVGYTRKYIIAKALREISAASFIGYVTGIIFSILLTWTLNICFFSDKGLDMPLISIGSMLNMILVPAAITVFSMIAPLKASRFRDLL